MMKFIILLLLTLIILTSAKPPINPYEATMKKLSTESGLYDSSDKVVILTSTNFNDEVLNRNRSSLVEFYNSYCGHCKRFAPVYKEMAENLHGWRDYLMVGAIDCAAEENSDICREYEIMGYPSLRFMKMNFDPVLKNYGESIDSQVPLTIKQKLANWLLEEHADLQALTTEQAEQLLAKKQQTDKSDLMYNFVVFEPENSTVGIQTKLHFRTWPRVNIWHTSEPDIATLFGLNAEKCIGNIEHGISFNCTGMKNPIMARLYIAMIEENLNTFHVTEKPEPTSTTLINNINQDESRNDDVIAYVKSQKHAVYQADLEMAVHTILTTEVPRAADISGEKLLALKRILAVIKRYQPLSKYGSGNTLVARIYNYTTDVGNKFDGREFGLETHRVMEELPKPIFVSDNYVGCLGSHANSRGFTCSLWQLFHHLTVQSANHNDGNEGTLDVLQAIHGYVKHFFGCTDCSQHFQEMSVRRNIWDVASKDNAVIWLWSAHNEVNNRLKGDTTEDAEFPKIQFPSEESCLSCHHPTTLTLNNQTEDDMVVNSTGINWNKSAVLNFLKNIHNPENINQYGIKYLNISANFENLRQKRMINAFSDLDMRVGMLLYAFCIGMIILAFKLFAFKGSHRRKNYTTQEMLGKV